MAITDASSTQPTPTLFDKNTGTCDTYSNCVSLCYQNISGGCTSWKLLPDGRGTGNVSYNNRTSTHAGNLAEFISRASDAELAKNVVGNIIDQCPNNVPTPPHMTEFITEALKRLTDVKVKRDQRQVDLYELLLRRAAFFNNVTAMKFCLDVLKKVSSELTEVILKTLLYKGTEDSLSWFLQHPGIIVPTYFIKPFEDEVERLG